MGAKRATLADDGHPAAGRAEPAGVYAAGLDRAVAVLGESATLCVLNTKLSYAATVGDDLADSTRSLTDVDHQVADAETWHVAPPGFVRLLVFTVARNKLTRLAPDDQQVVGNFAGMVVGISFNHATRLKIAIFA
jgi:hypothetical protein